MSFVHFYNKAILVLIVTLTSGCGENDSQSIEPSVTNDSLNIKPNVTNEDKVFQGNLEFNNQSAIDQFQKKGYTLINGDVYIGPKEEDTPYKYNSTDINNLLSLEEIRAINGKLTLFYNHELTSLDGLDNIDSLGSLWISWLENLEDIDALESIQHINGAIDIHLKQKLPVVNFLTNQNTKVSRLRITNASKFEGLHKLESIKNTDNILDGYLEIIADDINIFRDVTSFNGKFIIKGANKINFNELKKIDGYFQFRENFVVDMNGFEKITYIRRCLIVDNSKLSNLSGLEKLTSVGPETSVLPMRVLSNVQLNDFCGIKNLLMNNSKSIFEALYNDYNPTAEDINNDDCKK